MKILEIKNISPVYKWFRQFINPFVLIVPCLLNAYWGCDSSQSETACEVFLHGTWHRIDAQ